MHKRVPAYIQMKEISLENREVIEERLKQQGGIWRVFHCKPGKR